MRVWLGAEAGRKHRTVSAGLIGVLVMSGCGDGSEVDRAALGADLYLAHCAACHGAKMEGYPNWTEKPPAGRPLAPPLDDSGQAWRYKDRQLFTLVKNGYVPPYSKAGRESDMPGFRDRLTDEQIHAVLDYVRASWSDETQKKRAELLIKPRRH